MKKLSIVTFIIFMLDRISKILITNIGLIESKSIINNFFNITLAHNYGAAWSSFMGQRMFLIIVAIINLVAIYYIFIKNRDLTKYESIIYGILIGGIIGNLFDRIIYGYVIDFLDFNILGYDYPIFNLADSFIVISVILIIIHEIRRDYVSRRGV